MEDIILFDKGLDLGDFFTIRVGEVVWDNLEDRLISTVYELVKIRGDEEGQCLYYNHDRKACTIYEMRPVQCRAFFCMAPEDFQRTFERPKLTRREIFQDSPGILRLIEAHEERCSYVILDNMLKELETGGDQVANDIIDLLLYDKELRRLAEKRLDIPARYLDLILGRPMETVLKYYGLSLRCSEGKYFLQAQGPLGKEAPA